MTKIYRGGFGHALDGENATRDAALKPKRQYIQTGKFYYLASPDDKLVWLRGSGNSEHDVDLVVPIDQLFEAGFFTRLPDAKAHLQMLAKYERSDFGKGREAKALYDFIQTAVVRALVFKTRAIRIATHLEKGD